LTPTNLVLTSNTSSQQPPKSLDTSVASAVRVLSLDTHSISSNSPNLSELSSNDPLLKPPETGQTHASLRVKEIQLIGNTALKVRVCYISAHQTPSQSLNTIKRTQTQSKHSHRTHSSNTVIEHNQKRKYCEVIKTHRNTSNTSQIQSNTSNASGSKHIETHRHRSTIKHNQTYYTIRRNQTHQTQTHQNTSNTVKHNPSQSNVIKHINSHQLTSKHIKTPQNTSKHIKTHQNTSNISYQTHQNASKHIKTHQNTSKHIKLITHIKHTSKHIKNFNTHQTHMKTHQKHITYFKKFLSSFCI